MVKNSSTVEPECEHVPAIKVRVEMDDGTTKRLCEICLMEVARKLYWERHANEQ